MEVEYSEPAYSECPVDNNEPFTYLPEFEEHIDEIAVDFVFPFNSQVNCLENVGSILLVISDREVVNIKFSVDHYDKEPLKIKKSSKFTSISGQNIISNQFYTYIHDKNGYLYKFRSSHSLDKIRHENVLLLQCFNFYDTSYFIMIALIGSTVVLQIYDEQFDKEYSTYHRSVDLILREDAIPTLENEFTFEKLSQNYAFACEMLSNVTENALDVEFFNTFLDIKITQENIRDILLVSINDRLYYVKYRGPAEEGSSDMSEDSSLMLIEPVIISRGNIKAIKYLDSSIIILDDFWVLSIFYQCVTTNIIKRREIPLGNQISCYKFVKDQLIYSTRHKIVFMKFKIAPSEPEISIVPLELVATFSVAENSNFLVAIDRNKWFYYVPIPKNSNKRKETESQEQYVSITNDQVKKLPGMIKYFENVEEELAVLSKAIKDESNILMFLNCLELTKDIIAGHAKIKYVPFLTATQPDDIICDQMSCQSGHGYVRIVINLSPVLSAFSFTIAFYRHTEANGTLVKYIDISPRNEKLNFAIYVPDEVYDNEDNKLDLCAHFHLNKTEQCDVLEFPFIIDSIKVSSGYQNRTNIEVENCIKALNKLLDKQS